MQKVSYPSDVTEATADFTKSHSLLHKDFIDAQKLFNKAKSGDLKRLFLNYCMAVIHQNSEGSLTIREAAYVIGSIDKEALLEDPQIKAIIVEAGRLQRHPSNYRNNHAVGWKNLVKSISELRRRSN